MSAPPRRLAVLVVVVHAAANVVADPETVDGMYLTNKRAAIRQPAAPMPVDVPRSNVLQRQPVRLQRRPQGDQNGKFSSFGRFPGNGGRAFAGFLQQAQPQNLRRSQRFQRPADSAPRPTKTTMRGQRMITPPRARPRWPVTVTTRPPALNGFSPYRRKTSTTANSATAEMATTMAATTTTARTSRAVSSATMAAPVKKVAEIPHADFLRPPLSPVDNFNGRGALAAGLIGLAFVAVFVLATAGLAVQCLNERLRAGDTPPPVLAGLISSPSDDDDRTPPELRGGCGLPASLVQPPTDSDGRKPRSRADDCNGQVRTSRGHP